MLLSLSIGELILLGISIGFVMLMSFRLGNRFFPQRDLYGELREEFAYIHWERRSGRAAYCDPSLQDENGECTCLMHQEVCKLAPIVFKNELGRHWWGYKYDHDNSWTCQCKPPISATYLSLANYYPGELVGHTIGGADKIYPWSN